MSELLDTHSIRLVPEFLPDSLGLFEQLVAAIAWDDRTRARKAASFGVPYNYSGIEWPTVTFPSLLLPILDRVAETVGFTPNNCLAHFYPTSASTMGFHSDATEELEPETGIAIVSLGVERAITFRRFDKTGTESHLLPSGSLLRMSLPMQSEWKHAILPGHFLWNGQKWVVEVDKSGVRICNDAEVPPTVSSQFLTPRAS